MMGGLWLLFGAAFLAASLIPAQSEAVLVGLILGQTYPVWLLVLVAGISNVLGSCVNWGLGRVAETQADKRWFPISRANLACVQDRYQRWGWISLLASWVPIIGDPITLAAGVMREPLWRFVLVVSIAKFGRYIVLATTVLGAVHFF